MAGKTLKTVLVLLLTCVAAGGSEEGDVWTYESLKGCPGAELLAYMGAGSNKREVRDAATDRRSLPEGYWEADPVAATLALLEQNRSPDHKKTWKLSIPDEPTLEPPDRGTVRYTYRSDRSYTAVDAHFFLRCHPEGSYFLFGMTTRAGAVFRNVLESEPTYDIRDIRVPYEEARRLLVRVWRLRQVHSERSHPSGTSVSRGSTADGRGDVELRTPHGDVAVRSRTWAGRIAERFTKGFDDEAFVNFVGYLLGAGYPERLGDEWHAWGPAEGIPGWEDPAKRAELNRRHKERLERAAARLVDLASTSEDRVSFEIATLAAEAAGVLALTDRKSSLEGALKRLPEAAKVPEHRKEALGAFRESVTESARMLETAEDPEELAEWARSLGEGSMWAMAQLRERAPAIYVDILTGWLDIAPPADARQLYAAIIEVDRPRAVELAKTRTPTGQKALAVMAFRLLEEEPGEVPDLEARLAQLIEILLDPESGFEERANALDLLVPKEQPGRYPSAKIDAALIEVLTPELADDVINFTLGQACHALARRGGLAHFDRIRIRMDTVADPDIWTELLSDLARLSLVGKPEHRTALRELIAPELVETEHLLPELVWSAWAADLRDLHPALARIATSGPDETEGPKASSWGLKSPVVENYHLPRKALSLWSEEDPFTRARMLLAFGAMETYELLREDRPERKLRYDAELESAADGLDGDQLASLKAFLVEALGPERDDPGDREWRERTAGALLDALSR